MRFGAKLTKCLRGICERPVTGGDFAWRVDCEHCPHKDGLKDLDAELLTMKYLGRVPMPIDGQPRRTIPVLQRFIERRMVGPI